MHNNEKLMSKRTEPTFIQDKFKKNIKVTFFNLLSSALFFIVLLTPFIIIGLAMYYFHDEIIIHYMHFLIRFFGCWLIFFLIYIPILTINNNHRTKHTYHHQINYSEKRVIAKTDWLHHYYTKKFGKDLHQHKIYIVAKDNNIPVDYIIKTYQKKDNQ